MRKWSHKGRIYRNTRTLTEGNRLNHPDGEDIYSEDKWMTLHPDYDSIFSIPGNAVQLRSGVLVTYSNVDIQPGYIIELKKLKYVNGVVSAVSETVTENPTLGATTLTVANVVKFEPGDSCIISDSSGAYRFILKAASGTTLTMYTDKALERAFTSATVAVKDFWAVKSVKDKSSFSSWQEFNVETIIQEVIT